jgi:hypothetical protein
MMHGKSNIKFKEFRFEYDKRMVMPEKDGTIETLPWGY